MKISQGTAPPRATATLAVGLIAIPAVMAASHPAAAHASHPVAAHASHPTPGPPSHPAAAHKGHAARTPRQPGLTISVNDGHVTARAGDRLTYTVTLRDTGTMAAPHLKVTQTMSAGLTFLSASAHGVAKNDRVTWSASLPVGGTKTFRVATRVTKTPATLLRLAAVACVELPGSSSRPVVCAAHLDRLPAAAAQAASASGRSDSGLLTYTAAGLAVLALGLLSAIAVRRRGRPRRRTA
jgi:uncharacterized repeat protein (TIGR01451 family)